MLTARDIMTTNVITIGSSATVAEAAKLMKEKELRALIVEPHSGKYSYGIVTETDIVYKVAAFSDHPQKMRVLEIMTKSCLTLSPNLRVEYVARLFAQTKTRRAPVIEKKLLGIISLSDLLKKGNFVEKPIQMFIEDRINTARNDARKICEQKGKNSFECAAANNVVEELGAAVKEKMLLNQILLRML